MTKWIFLINDYEIRREADLDFFKSINLTDLLTNFAGYIGFEGPVTIVQAVLDVGIVTYIIYKIIILLRETRAWQVIKGILFILVISELSKLLGLKTIAYIAKNSLSVIAFAIVVLFQPELRRGLEQIGRSRFRFLVSFDEGNNRIRVTAMIEEIIKACTELSKSFIGALIIIERDTKVGDVINTGTQLDSNISAELLINIFMPNAPLHDGAVIIRGSKLKAAACFLPLTDNPNLSRELGTRHRAALGITEVSDSIAIVVSEESGKISFAMNGGLSRNYTPDILRKALNKNLLDQTYKKRKIALWKSKSKEIKTYRNETHS